MTDLLFFGFLNIAVYYLLSSFSIATKKKVITSIVVSLLLMVVIKMTGYLISSIWDIAKVVGPFVLIFVVINYFVTQKREEKKG